MSERFVAQVPIRWTDQDSYGHLNNARAITLLEEARIRFLWSAAGQANVPSFTGGLLVAGLHADYRRQVNYHWDTTLRVTMGIDEVRAASFRILYELHDGPDEDAAVAVTAWTRMALFDMRSQRPRRLAPDERMFLARFQGVGQCGVLQGGGEDPRGRSAMAERAVAGRVDQPGGDNQAAGQNDPTM